MKRDGEVPSGILMKIFLKGELKWKEGERERLLDVASTGSYIQARVGLV